MIPELRPNEKGQLTDIDGKKRKFHIKRYVTMPETDHPNKQFILQEIVFDDNSERILRLAYYILGKKPKMRGKWVWGQFCPFILKEDLKKLLELARKEGII